MIHLVEQINNHHIHTIHVNHFEQSASPFSAEKSVSNRFFPPRRGEIETVAKKQPTIYEMLATVTEGHSCVDMTEYRARIEAMVVAAPFNTIAKRHRMLRAGVMTYLEQHSTSFEVPDAEVVRAFALLLKRDVLFVNEQSKWYERGMYEGTSTGSVVVFRATGVDCGDHLVEKMIEEKYCCRQPYTTMSMGALRKYVGTWSTESAENISKTRKENLLQMCKTRFS